MTKELCNIKELSNYLKISIPEIRKLVRERRIPNFRLGNRIMFDLNEVNKWIDKLAKQESINSIFY